MKNISQNIKNMLLLLILLALSLSFLQEKLQFIQLSPLKGAITIPDNPTFSWRRWFSGEYQHEKEKYINQSFGLRSIFIRINNQLAFNLFKKAKANGVIIGKDNYLYEEHYILTNFGKDYVGDEKVADQMEKLSFIQDTLAQMEKTLLIVFAPGKGYYYPEYYPRKYYKLEKGPTNYEEYSKQAKAYGINHIDFNQYFKENRSISPYPLYPQYGIHWSTYGSMIAGDSIIRYLEEVRNIDMQNFYWDTVDITQPQGVDYDIADGMNLIQRLKSFEMAYPKLIFESDSGKVKPSILVISDSFYWNLYSYGFIYVFNKQQFWFYNSQVYPNDTGVPLYRDTIDLSRIIDETDIFMIMGTDGTMNGFGWNFIENLYNRLKCLDPACRMKDIGFRQRVNAQKEKIKADEDLMKSIENKAKERYLSIDSMLTLDAIWILDNE